MIALTGASGFLGRHLVEKFHARNIPFRALVRQGSKNLTKLSHLTNFTHTVDYKSSKSIREGLEGCSTLIHTLGVINADEATLHEVNERITQHLILAAKDAGVGKVIHISSVAAVMRHGPYGESKFHGESFVKHSGIAYTTLRPAYIYGMGDENNTALLVRTLKRWPIVPLLGGGSFKLQPVYVEDVVNLILKAIEMPAQNSEFNVAGAAQISLKSMLIELSQALKVKRLFLPIPLKPVQSLLRIYLKVFPNTKLPAKQILELDKHEAFDISKTREVFGFNPLPYSLGVKKMFEAPSCAG